MTELESQIDNQVMASILARLERLQTTDRDLCNSEDINHSLVIEDAAKALDHVADWIDRANAGSLIIGGSYYTPTLRKQAAALRTVVVAGNLEKSAANVAQFEQAFGKGSALSLDCDPSTWGRAARALADCKDDYGFLVARLRKAADEVEALQKMLRLST